MSKYRIYRVDNADPRRLGRRKRLLFSLYSILTPLASIALNSIDEIGGNFLMVLLVVLPVTTALYLLLYFKLKNNRFETIGEIEFTTGSIIKKLGDATTRYDYRDVKGIELEKHIPSVTARESKSGFFSYILKIDFLNAPSVSIIVSDKPTDKDRNLSITETLGTLKKLIAAEIRIDK
jgi:hypothetical protein